MRSPAWASTSAWPRRWTRCCWSMAWCRRGISSRTQSIGAAGNGTHCRPAMAWPRSSTLQEPQIERCEHQDYSNVHHQPFPEPVPEEQDVHADNDGYQREHVKHDDCLSSHPAFLVRAAEWNQRHAWIANEVFLGMSALGHKRTFRSAIAVSALSQKRTCAVQKGMSAKGH